MWVSLQIVVVILSNFYELKLGIFCASLLFLYRYTSKMLLAAIDENHRGTYDFLYLPIDFKVNIIWKLVMEPVIMGASCTVFPFLLLLMLDCF